MKRTVVGLCLSLAFATVMVAAQTTPPPAQDQQKTPDQSLTGCLTQGSGPTVFILDNARRNASDRAEKGARYLIVEAGEDLGLKSHLNHEVTVTGAPEAKMLTTPPAAGQKPIEKDLPKFSVKTVTEIADRCMTAPR
jgi:hypothetical protein